MTTDYTEATKQALEILRTPETFQYYLIPILAFVIYTYVVEIERKRWDIVATAFFLFTLEVVWEMFNAMTLVFSGYSAICTTPGNTGFLIFVGFPIEIFLMYHVAGIGLLKVLPKDVNARILGVPSRLMVAGTFASLFVSIEVMLNRGGIFVWAYGWWDWWLLIPLYVSGFYVTTMIFDKTSLRTKAILCGSGLGTSILGWIVLVEVLKLI